MLSNGNSIAEVISVTVLGILIVFAVLIILMAVLALMKSFASEEKSEAPVIKNTQATPVQKNDDNEEELIAVFAAAIASMLNTSAYNLKIKSYKRLPNKGTK